MDKQYYMRPHRSRTWKEPGKKGAVMAKLAGVFTTQQAILQAWCLTSKWHLCVWQKNSENATPRHITNIRSCYLLALSLFPSLSLPSSLFLRVTVSGRGEDLSRNTNTHHLNENSSLPPPQLSVLNPHTHKHITIDCHVRPRYPLQTSWLLDPAWQFKCIQKKLERLQTAILFCPLQRRVKNYNCFILASAEWTNIMAEVTGSEREDIPFDSFELIWVQGLSFLRVW